MRHSRIQTVCLFFFTILLINGMAHPHAADSLASIDEHNRFILNGEPFFPLGLYVWLAGPFPDTDELDEIAGSPFDTLMHYNTAVASDPENIAFLEALNLRGLKLIFSLSRGGCNVNGVNPPNSVCEMPWTIPEFVTFVEDEVTIFGGDPAIIAWYLNDEICPVCLDYLEAGYQKIKDLGDTHPVWSVHWNTAWLVQEAHTTDIVGVDPHTDYTTPPILTAIMADGASATGKPLWVAPQIDRATATPENIRAMTYVAVNHGAKGLIYYCYSAIGDTRWQQIKEIASEIDQLRPVFLSIDQTSVNDIVCDNGDIDFKLMREGNTYYLFAVNTKEAINSGVSFQINLSQKPSAFETMFEGGRQISVVNGKVTDNFGIYEVHVYYWEEPENVGGGRGGGSSGGCFVATAAFGSYIDPHVQVIKDFRDEYLLTNMPGRWFVSMYNTYGPFWADFLNAHPRCKPFVRLALMPVVGISYFALNTSLATKLLTGLLLMGLVVICVLRVHGRSATCGQDLGSTR